MMKSTYYVQRVGVGFFSCLLIFFFLAGVQPLQAEMTASASLNVLSFPMDRAATLSLTIQGVRSFQEQMAEVDGLRFHQRGQSTQVEIINGAYSASVTSVYLVQALREGKFTIPPIKILTKEGAVETEEISFEVTAPQSAAVPNQPRTGSSSTARLRSGEGDKVAFMRVTPAKKESYSGERVPVEIKVYFRDGIKANLNSLPHLVGEGFVLQQLGREPIQTREIVNNTRYSVLSWESALSGIKEGEHSLSMELDATLLLREQRRRNSRGPSMFGDSFFDNFFGTYREKEVKVASPEMATKVLPLPEKGRPETFSGAIGNFSLQVDADPVELNPGDPVTLTMTVAGQGNFDRVQAPQLSEKKGWKSYTPSSEFFKDGPEGSGKKVFEQALVLKEPDLKEIPPLLFSYFDPDDGDYKTLRSAPIPLTISGADVKEPDPAPLPKEKEQTETAASPLAQLQPPIAGLAPLQLAPGDMEQEIRPLFGKKWFQLLLLLLLLVLLAAFIYKVRATRYAKNPRLQRDKAMKQLLDQRLKELEEKLAAGDNRGFLSCCRQAIQEQFGLAWGVEAGAITSADLVHRLSPDSILLVIFRAADESAYGGRELSGEEMQEFAQGLKNELEGLR